MELSNGLTVRPKPSRRFLVTEGIFCAFAGARGAMSILEKVGCDHAKVVVQPDLAFSANDVRNPSVEATTLGSFILKYG
jgi:hypothetical protein